MVDRNNKVAKNREDLLQHVWVELLHREVLLKYRQYCTGYQVGQRIRPYWRNRQARLTGTAETPVEVPVELDGSVLPGPSDRNGTVPTKRPMSFRTYLSATVRNIWANWCRTHARRFDREDPSSHLPWFRQ